MLHATAHVFKTRLSDWFLPLSFPLTTDVSLCGRFGVVKQANSLPLEENDRYSTEILHALTILCGSYHSQTERAILNLFYGLQVSHLTHSVLSQNGFKAEYKKPGGMCPHVDV